ncbi:P-loop guanosine triphosphatase YjiA [Nymphon striatum]|nr:P-loop guanosine triphosphatase YjiA [Nymphon striatum]
MTAYVAFRAIKAGDVQAGSPVVISAAARKQPPSKMGYKKGVKLRIDTAIKIIIIKSANDVSHALAEAISGNLKAFVASMNGEAKRLGMNNTQFANSNGLHSPNQYSSARDLALLSAQILKEFPQYAYMFEAAAIKTTQKTHYSYNLLLERFAGANGMKTGFVCASGYNFIGSAARGGRTLIAVVLGTSSQTERAVSAAHLLDNGFKSSAAVKNTIYNSSPPRGENPKNMRPILCTEKARSSRYDPGAGQAKITSAHLYPRRVSSNILTIKTGGIDAPPGTAAFANIAEIPVPTRRPKNVLNVGDIVLETIGIYILSGFLGSGKTTLLNKLLKLEAFSNTLVIVNEFGEVALDHLLIEKSSDTILELSNGCLCCSIRGELVETLLGLEPTNFDRVIVETTGIADPLPIFQSLAYHPILARTYAPAEVLTVFDCLRGEDLILQHEEAQKQLSIADVVILTKNDLVENTSDARRFVENYNQLALIVEDPSLLNPHTISQRLIKPSELSHGHATKFTSMLLETDQLLDVKTISGLLHHLASALAENLLRIKGFAKIETHPNQPLLVQVSGQVVHDFEILEKWKTEQPKTQLVVIAKNIDPKLIQTIFDAFMGNLAIDTPDKKTVMDNPLSIPGFEI